MFLQQLAIAGYRSRQRGLEINQTSDFLTVPKEVQIMWSPNGETYDSKNFQLNLSTSEFSEDLELPNKSPVQYIKIIPLSWSYIGEEVANCNPADGCLSVQISKFVELNDSASSNTTCTRNAQLLLETLTECSSAVVAALDFLVSSHDRAKKQKEESLKKVRTRFIIILQYLI